MGGVAHVGPLDDQAGRVVVFHDQVAEQLDFVEVYGVIANDVGRCFEEANLVKILL